jgi:uncharacterized protein YbjT (DUF2867 family)
LDTDSCGGDEAALRCHDALPAAPDTGVNTVTGEGLEAALDGAAVIIDLANSRSFEPSSAMDFLRRTRKTLLPRKRAPASGMTSYSRSLAVIVRRNGYFRAKVVQEQLVKGSGIPFTVVRSTRFMEFLGSIADTGQKDGVINIATGLFQPIAADDVAAFEADAALAAPRNGTIEIAGPERVP